MIKHASLVVVFSDLLMEPEPVITALRQLRHGGNDVILDFSDASFVDSSVIRVVMRAAKSAAMREQAVVVQVGTAAIVERVFEVIVELHRAGTAVLLVEQNVAKTLAVADRAYVLSEGRIVSAGPPGRLLAEPEIRSAYLGDV